jgi:hypothetical protein
LSIFLHPLTMDPDDAAERERQATAERLMKTIEDSAASLRKLVPSADEAATHERVRELEFQNNTLSLRVQQLEATLRAYESRRNTFDMPGDDNSSPVSPNASARTRYPLEHLEIVAAAASAPMAARQGSKLLPNGNGAAAMVASCTPPPPESAGGAGASSTVQRFAKLNGTAVNMPMTLEALADMQRNPRGLLTKSRSATFHVRSKSIEDVLEGAKHAMPQLDGRMGASEQEVSQNVQEAFAPSLAVASSERQQRVSGLGLALLYIWFNSMTRKKVVLLYPLCIYMVAFVSCSESMSII